MCQTTTDRRLVGRVRVHVDVWVIAGVTGRSRRTMVVVDWRLVRVVWLLGGTSATTATRLVLWSTHTHTLIIGVNPPKPQVCKDTYTHAHHRRQQQQQPSNGRLSGTTRVGRYQKKHSPAHTHRWFSWSMYFLYHFSPFATVHGILFISNAIYKCIFQIKYIQKQFYQTALGNCYVLKL